MLNPKKALKNVNVGVLNVNVDIVDDKFDVTDVKFGVVDANVDVNNVNVDVFDSFYGLFWMNFVLIYFLMKTDLFPALNRVFYDELQQKV